MRGRGRPLGVYTYSILGVCSSWGVNGECANLTPVDATLWLCIQVNSYTPTSLGVIFSKDHDMANKGKVLVTGATGFVGRAVCKRLREDSAHELAGTTRKSNSEAGPEGVPLYCVPEIGPNTDWTQAVSNADIVIHLAARVHIMKEKSLNPFAAFHRVNSEGTKALATQAAAKGVKRFIFASSN